MMGMGRGRARTAGRPDLQDDPDDNLDASLHHWLGYTEASIGVSVRMCVPPIQTGTLATVNNAGGRGQLI